MTIVHGLLVDTETRCTHYHSDLDIVAIKFKCCNRYYACFRCHEELEGHGAAVWSEEEFGERAILCGACKSELSIRGYLASGFACPCCQSPFNPGCAKHYDLYFGMHEKLSAELSPEKAAVDLER